MFFVVDVSSIIKILFLIFLEGLLSVDNALALAVMVRFLPPAKQRKALTYGIWGAFGFRALALFFLTSIIEFPFIKICGGAYLLGISLGHFLPFGKPDPQKEHKDVSAFKFWRIVATVELLDVSFSADSILASLSVSSNYFILLCGGILGILTMRIASWIFVKLINKYPKMEQVAYILILIMGMKLLAEGMNYL